MLAGSRFSAEPHYEGGYFVIDRARKVIVGHEHQRVDSGIFKVNKKQEYTASVSSHGTSSRLQMVVGRKGFITVCMAKVMRSVDNLDKDQPLSLAHFLRLLGYTGPIAALLTRPGDDAGFLATFRATLEYDVAKVSCCANDRLTLSAARGPRPPAERQRCGPRRLRAAKLSDPAHWQDRRGQRPESLLAGAVGQGAPRGQGRHAVSCDANYR